MMMKNGERKGLVLMKKNRKKRVNKGARLKEGMDMPESKRGNAQ